MMQKSDGELITQKKIYTGVFLHRDVFIFAIMIFVEYTINDLEMCMLKIDGFVICLFSLLIHMTTVWIYVIICYVCRCSWLVMCKWGKKIKCDIQIYMFQNVFCFG